MPGMMDKHRDRRGKWQLALVILIPTLAMGLAWVMYFTGLWLPEGRTNKGELLLPPALLGNLQLMRGLERIEPEATEGVWRLVVFGSPGCEEQACQDTLYKTRQVHIALGKEAERVVRFYVAPATPMLDPQLEQQHPGVLWLSASESMVRKTIGVDRWPQNRFFVIDPLGNVIMGYQAKQPGGDLLKDLRKLLKASNIG